MPNFNFSVVPSKSSQHKTKSIYNIKKENINGVIELLNDGKFYVNSDDIYYDIAISKIKINYIYTFNLQNVHKITKILYNKCHHNIIAYPYMKYAPGIKVVGNIVKSTVDDKTYFQINKISNEIDFVIRNKFVNNCKDLIKSYNERNSSNIE